MSFGFVLVESVLFTEFVPFLNRRLDRQAFWHYFSFGEILQPFLQLLGRSDCASDQLRVPKDHLFW